MQGHQSYNKKDYIRWIGRVSNNNKKLSWLLILQMYMPARTFRDCVHQCIDAQPPTPELHWEHCHKTYYMVAVWYIISHCGYSILPNDYISGLFRVDPVDYLRGNHLTVMETFAASMEVHVIVDEAANQLEGLPWTVDEFSLHCSWQVLYTVPKRMSSIGTVKHNAYSRKTN